MGNKLRLERVVTLLKYDIILDICESNSISATADKFNFNMDSIK